MKSASIDTETVIQFLDRIASIEVLPSTRLGLPQHLRRDESISFRHAGQTYTLIVDVKPNGAPRYARAASLQLKGLLLELSATEEKRRSKFLPMFVATYLSPESREICKNHEIAYLDLFDNAYLKFDDVYIDWATAERPKSETRALRSVFKPKAAAVLRALLRHPDRAWRVVELSKESKASLGHVSNVRKSLLEREWVERTDEGVVLVSPSGLLSSWRENYRRPFGSTTRGYTHFHGQELDELLATCLEKHGRIGRAICASHLSARWIAPYVRGTSLTFYVDEGGMRRLRSELRMSPVNKGSNVTLIEVDDETLFEDAIEPVPGIFCTDPITTCLDLWNGNDRDREAAEFLARECFPWY